LDPELKDALSVAIALRNVDPLYILYSNGMEVLGKQLTKPIGLSESVSYV